MSTITTKQLRENMSQVIRDLRQGKSVQLSYRHSIIGVLQPIQVANQTLKRGSPQAIRKGLYDLKAVVLPDSVSKDTRSIKEQIAELRDGKYRNE
jgi:antitoxin (DNA-binding transcriptional repressor) of toxin-antitoxin stability system